MAREVSPMAKLQMSLRLDAALVRRAQKVLGARTKTEVVERSLAAIVEIEKHRRLIRRFGGTGKRYDFRDS
jgi:hypothetical protein